MTVGQRGEGPLDQQGEDIQDNKKHENAGILLVSEACMCFIPCDRTAMLTRENRMFWRAQEATNNDE